MSRNSYVPKALTYVHTGTSHLLHQIAMMHFAILNLLIMTARELMAATHQ